MREIPKLFYSERMLWDRCEEAHPALERLSRYRATHRSVWGLCDSSTTGMVSVAAIVAAFKDPPDE